MSKDEKAKLESAYDEGVIERGEGYLDNVKSCVKIGGFLFAEVHGSSVYKTKVNLDTLDGECSCPYGSNCKHAVAAYLYHKKGRSVDGDGFLAHLKSLSKEELISLIESILPDNPRLIKKHTFRKKTDFGSFVNDFIKDFSLDNLESLKENLDCLSFEQLLKVLDYTSKNGDEINDKICEDYDSYDPYDDEEDVLGDFEYDAKQELIKKTVSKEQLEAVLKKKYANEEITENPERFFKHKDLIKKYFSREEYLVFLLGCNNPSLAEIKDSLDRRTEHYLLTMTQGNIALAERLAEYLDNDDLRFMVSYRKEDAKGIIKHFGNFPGLKKSYLVQPEHVARILSKGKEIPTGIAKKLFTKGFFKDYSPKSIRFLADNISDKQYIIENTDLGAKLPQLKEAFRRLEELGYDTRQAFKKKEMLEGKPWEEKAEIARLARKSFGDSFAESLIKKNKEQFINSSTLKHNLKKDGITIQNIRGELKVEIR